MQWGYLPVAGDVAMWGYLPLAGERNGAHDPAPTTMQSVAMRRNGAHDR